MTGRGLQPKYTHRKNTRHLLKNMNNEPNRQASSHLTSVDKQASTFSNQFGNSNEAFGMRAKKNSVDQL